MKRISFIILLAVLCLSSYGFSQTAKVSGYMFSDYYWVSANHNEDLEGQNGFWFRRIYFTYDNKVEDGFDVRLRLEMSSPGNFTDSQKLEPAIKDAYLKWKLSNHQVLFGISGTPTWGIVEKVWGYRSVEKSPLDLQKLGSSRDFGIALKGSLDSSKRITYHFMFGNGESTKSETNKHKKLYLSLGFRPAKSIILEVYADLDNRADGKDRNTFQGFTAYQTKSTRIGVQFAHQTRKGNPVVDLRVASVFGAYRFSEKLEAFARFDHMFDPNPDGKKISYIPFDHTAKSNFIVAGASYSPNKNVHFIPNVEAVFYDDTGNQPGTDLIPRLTLHYIWK